MTARVGTALFAAAAILGAPGSGSAQIPDISGYYLHAGVAVDESRFTERAAMSFQRLRLMARPGGEAWTLNVAYEHTLTLRTDALALGRGFEGAEPAAPWLDLQRTLVDRRRAEWAHGLDRLSLSVHAGDRARITAGRQTVSWASTLYFTPADPFVPFDPSDPFREFRAGVDALRVVWFLGPLSELDVVVRPARRPGGGDTMTALLRAQGLFRGWEVSAWGGAVHDEPAFAGALVGGLGDTALRGEGGIRRIDGETVVRVAAGVDRWFEALDRDLHVIVEYQHDGFGATRAEELLPAALSEPATRGELQVLGRDSFVVAATLQWHPLTDLTLLTLVNARDGSALLAPGLTRSLADDASLRVGAFAGLGRGAAPAALRSEHGAVPVVLYAALSLFF